MGAEGQPVSLDEVAARSDEREKVIAELTARDVVARDSQRDKAIFALAVSFTIAAGILLPTLAAIVAFACRVFIFVLRQPVPWW